MKTDALDPISSFQYKTFLDELLYADWESPFSPLQFIGRLTLAEASRSTFFLNARCFLKALAEQKGASLTATGNLNRAFVASILDHLNLDKPYREMLLKINKVIN